MPMKVLTKIEVSGWVCVCVSMWLHHMVPIVIHWENKAVLEVCKSVITIICVEKPGGLCASLTS